MKNNESVIKVQRQNLCADRNSGLANDRTGLLEAGPFPRTVEPAFEAESRWPLAKLKRKGVLLVSSTAELARDLNQAADLLELGFKQTSDPTKALWLAGQTRAAVVFVDLDLPTLAGWNVAERLLHNESSPALILLTERNDHFDLEAAIQSGAVVAKSAGPIELLSRLSQSLAEVDANRIERIARQWMLLRWLRPMECPVSVPDSDRYRGINE